jgi:dynein heavy chain 1
MRLAQIRLEEAGGDADLEWPYAELEFLTKNKIAGPAATLSSAVWAVLPLPEPQRNAVSQLCALQPFKGLAKHIEQNAQSAWSLFVLGNGRTPLPTGWEDPATVQDRPTTLALHRLLVVKCMRPDRLVEFSHDTAQLVLGSACVATPPLELRAVVTQESSSSSPLLLVSRPGYDASAKVEALAAGMPGYQSFAMGSAEGFQQADAAITMAAKKGHWVLLKNVHLAPSWLAALEKRLHRLAPHPSFRLFLTSEIHPLLPANLLRQATRIVFEPPAGVKASLQRTFASLTPARVNRAPAERSRLYLLLAWLHAVVLERVRYVPVGWSKAFEFSETDQQCAWDAFDEWIDQLAQGRANVAPSKLPWQALRTLLQDYIYGGRIDNEYVGGWWGRATSDDTDSVFLLPPSPRRTCSPRSPSINSRALHTLARAWSHSQV